MDWKEIGNLRELAEGLSSNQIVQAAISIEETRSVETEQALLEFHGLNVPGLITTPFMYQVGVCARDAGCVAFNGLERSFLPPKEAWIHPTLKDKDYECRLERDRLLSAKTWPFKQDGAMADFRTNIAPKWWSHGLVHSLTGFAYWPGMSEWDVMLMARVGEMVASLHWYWLAELGRAYCPLHTVASSDSTPDCDACRQLENEAAHKEVRLERLHEESAMAVALNGIQILQYEASAYEQGRSRGVMLQPQTKYLEMGEAADYALFHHRRLVSPEFRDYAAACLRPSLDYATSHEEYESRVIRTLADILTPRGELREFIPSHRARRVLCDLGARLIHGNSYQKGLALVGDALSALREEDSQEETDALIGETLQKLGEGSDSKIFQLGYRPTMSEAGEPDCSRKARLSAYFRRVNASGSPLLHFIPRAEEVAIDVINGARTSQLMDEVFHAATQDKGSEDMGELMRQAFLGWMQVAAESWGPDNASMQIAHQWMYRMAHQVFPDERLWPEIRMRPNPYLDAIPAPFDIKWLDDVIKDPTKPLKPKHALRVHYVLVGQGRRMPLFIPFTQPRKRLLNALQETPTVAELMEQGFSETQLREAFADELVIAIHHRDAFTLYVQSMGGEKHVQAPGPEEAPIATVEAASNPWDEEDQARYYEDFCGRSSLYHDLASATISFAGLALDELVADLGCGSGVSTKALLAEGTGKVLAIDPSPLMLTASARNVRDPRVELHLGRAEHLPLFLQERKLAGLLCNSAFWLDANLPQAISSIAAAMNPSGRFGMSIPAEFLGHYDHRLGIEAETFFKAVSEAREAFGIEFDEAKAMPQSPLLGDATRFLSALETHGLSDAEYTVWTYEWTAREYLDWLRQPTVAQAMAPNLEPAKVEAYMDAIAAAVEPELPLKSDWCLIRARKG